MNNQIIIALPVFVIYILCFWAFMHIIDTGLKIYCWYLDRKVEKECKEIIKSVKERKKP